MLPEFPLEGQGRLGVREAGRACTPGPSSDLQVPVAV